jgi:hypothetical protein
LGENSGDDMLALPSRMKSASTPFMKAVERFIGTLSERGHKMRHLPRER